MSPAFMVHSLQMWVHSWGGERRVFFFYPKWLLAWNIRPINNLWHLYFFFYFELLIKTRSCFLFSFIASSCFDRNVCAWKWSSKQYFCYHLSGMQTREICLSVQWEEGLYWTPGSHCVVFQYISSIKAANLAPSCNIKRYKNLHQRKVQQQLFPVVSRKA